MSNILSKATVLVLNRNWQAINVRTPQEAFCMMATNVATGLEIEGEDHIRPVTWEEWITLPVRDQDEAVHTVRGQIRVPTVIVAVNYAKVPKKRPKLCARAIRERDRNRCQYTGRVLRPDEGSPLSCAVHRFYEVFCRCKVAKIEPRFLRLSMYLSSL
jgi:hypothetical protein